MVVTPKILQWPTFRPRPVLKDCIAYLLTFMWVGCITWGGDTRLCLPISDLMASQTSASCHTHFTVYYQLSTLCCHTVPLGWPRVCRSSSNWPQQQVIHRQSRVNIKVMVSGRTKPERAVEAVYHQARYCDLVCILKSGLLEKVWGILLYILKSSDWQHSRSQWDTVSCPVAQCMRLRYIPKYGGFAVAIKWTSWQA